MLIRIIKINYIIYYKKSVGSNLFLKLHIKKKSMNIVAISNLLIDMNSIKKYLQNNKHRFEQELINWLRIPSISTLKANKPEIKKSAHLLMDYLAKAGLQKVKLIGTKGNPLVYAEKIVNSDLPTILIYGHYDVQPVDPLDLWTHPPFKPIIKNDKMYARGASDDKGQVFAHIKAFELMHATSGIPCNIKFLIEGEEEVGSESLYTFLQEEKNLELIKTDVVVVSDTSIQSMEQPSIPITLRGITSLQVKVQGPKRDLHSGVYGGAVKNPLEALCTLLSLLKNEKGQITVPGFYNSVINFSEKNRKKINQDFNLEQYKKELGVNDLHGEYGYTPLECIGIRPALDINGMWGGYTQEGVKTVLPACAYANISMRLVAHQDPMKIAQACKDYLISLAPKGVDIKIDIHPGGSKAFRTPSDATALQAARDAFKQVWGKSPIFTHEGGSIPILSKLQEVLGIDVVLLGFGLDSDNIHSPDEHFGLNNLYLGIETIVAFYQNFAKMHR